MWWWKYIAKEVNCLLTIKLIFITIQTLPRTILVSLWQSQAKFGTTKYSAHFYLKLFYIEPFSRTELLSFVPQDKTKQSGPYARISAAWWQPSGLAMAEFRWRSTSGCSRDFPCHRVGIARCPRKKATLVYGTFWETLLILELSKNTVFFTWFSF